MDIKVFLASEGYFKILSVNLTWKKREEKMKRLLFTLAMLVLLASVPTSEYQKISDKTEFLRLLGIVFIEKFQCENGAIVGSMEVGDKTLFFGDCVEKEKRVDL